MRTHKHTRMYLRMHEYVWTLNFYINLNINVCLTLCCSYNLILFLINYPLKYLFSFCCIKMASGIGTAEMILILHLLMILNTTYIYNLSIFYLVFLPQEW